MQEQQVTPPLIQAVIDNNFAQVIALLQTGCDIDTTHNNGMTPLFEALARGHESIAMILMAFGANINHKTGLQLDIIIACAAGGSVALLDFILKKLPQSHLNQVYLNNNTCLAMSLLYNNLEMSQYLLSNNALDKMPIEPLQLILTRAATSKHPHLTAQILAHPTFLDLKQEQQQTLLDKTLHEAVISNSQQAVNFLLKKNANPQADPETLKVALQKGYHDVVISCCDCIKELKDVVIGDFHLLHWAIFYNSIPMIDYLVKKGIDINIQTPQVNDTLMFGFRNKMSINTAHCLLKHKANSIHLPLGLAVGHQAWDIFNDLLKQGHKLNGDDGLSSPLRCAIHLNSSYQSLLRLIQLGANVHAIDENGLSIIHNAAQHGQDQLIRLLINKFGININLATQNDKHQTPLGIAQEHNQESTVTLLRALGARDLTHAPIHPTSVYRMGFREPLRTLDIPVQTASTHLLGTFYAANEDANLRLLQRVNRQLEDYHQQRAAQQQQNLETLARMMAQQRELEARLQEQDGPQDDPPDNDRPGKKIKIEQKKR